LFLGHYGVAFAAKRIAPRTSLGALSFAAQFLDALWPILLLLGIEQVRIVPRFINPNGLKFIYYPFSHSLVMAIVWGILIAAIYFLLTRYRLGAWVLGLLVLSHWFLDVPMHVRDLPLWPGASSPMVGWGWWNSIAVTTIVELTIFAAGISFYARSTRARDRIGSWGLWAYVLVLAGLFFASNGPPPASERALAWMALGIWVFVPWAWWVDKHRSPIAKIDAGTAQYPSTL
jgi:hypothetical protein